MLIAEHEQYGLERYLDSDLGGEVGLNRAG
jgi:hypothetical protein